MKYELTAMRLREAMANKGWRQQDLANASGVSKSNISHYVNGNHVPDSFMAWKLAQALDVQPDWIMGLDEAQDYIVVERTPLIDIIQDMDASQQRRLYEYARSLYMKEGEHD